jgi:hypothetical protein
MNRSLLPPAGSLEVDVVELFGSVTFGAAGAVASQDGKGIGTIVKETAAGQYTIPLSEPCNKFLWAGLTLLDDTDSDPTTVGVICRVLSQDVSNATAPEVVVQFVDVTDGSAANPASGAALHFILKLRNSTVG